MFKRAVLALVVLLSAASIAYPAALGVKIDELATKMNAVLQRSSSSLKKIPIALVNSPNDRTVVYSFGKATITVSSKSPRGEATLIDMEADNVVDFLAGWAALVAALNPQQNIDTATWFGPEIRKLIQSGSNKVTVDSIVYKMDARGSKFRLSITAAD
jgi:archaellum component FlaG (FlaF/FlaG flagellin family)